LYQSDIKELLSFLLAKTTQKDKSFFAYMQKCLAYEPEALI
jgi:hypothetical protein